MMDHRPDQAMLSARYSLALLSTAPPPVRCHVPPLPHILGRINLTGAQRNVLHGEHVEGVKYRSDITICSTCNAKCNLFPDDWYLRIEKAVLFRGFLTNAKHFICCLVTLRISLLIPDSLFVGFIDLNEWLNRSLFALGSNESLQCSVPCDLTFEQFLIF